MFKIYAACKFIVFIKYAFNLHLILYIIYASKDVYYPNNQTDTYFCQHNIILCLASKALEIID